MTNKQLKEMCDAIIRNGDKINYSKLSEDEIMKYIKNYVFDPNTTALTSKFTQFTDSLRRVNISFNLEKNKANMTELLNERRFLPITSLGYTRENINRVFNYLYEISEYIPKNEDSDPLKIIIKSISDDIEKMSIDLNQELANNKIKEGSPI